MSVTREDIEKKTGELVELLKNLEDGRKDAAEWICREVVIWAADNHYEGVGILTEALFAWREISLDILDEETKEVEETEEIR